MAPGMQQTFQDSSRTVAFGSNSESNSYRLDGSDLSDPDIGIGWLAVTAEAFEEVETLSIGTPAEFGQFTGAVVNIVTKSGGNRFEGNLSFYGQFQSLTADNNPKEKLDPSVPPEDAYLYPDSAYSYHRDQYYYASFALGGPVVKNRLWFFGTYERGEDDLPPIILPPPELEWKRDLWNTQTSVEWKGSGDFEVRGNRYHTDERNFYETNDKNPAESRFSGDVNRRIALKDRTLEVRSTLDVRSDEKNFHVTVVRYVYENGKLLRQREWKETIPRMFN